METSLENKCDRGSRSYSETVVWVGIGRHGRDERVSFDSDEKVLAVQDHTIHFKVQNQNVRACSAYRLATDHIIRSVARQVSLANSLRDNSWVHAPSATLTWKLYHRTYTN